MMTQVELEAEKIRQLLKRNKNSLTKALILQYDDNYKECCIITNTCRELKITFSLYTKLIEITQAEFDSCHNYIEEHTTTRKRLKAALKIIAPTRGELIKDILTDLELNSFV